MAPPDEKEPRKLSKVSVAELEDYVRKYRAQDFTYDEIRHSLFEQECDAQKIEKAIMRVQGEDDRDIRPTHNSKSYIIPIVFGYVFSIPLAFFFFSRSGFRGEFLYTPFNTFFSLIDSSMTGHLLPSPSCLS